MIKSKGLVNNLFWKFAERISAQFVTLLVSIILARLLDPSDYGLVAIVTIFISIANVFVSDGFGSALIQKKDADIIDFSSVFWVNLFFSILLYIGLFIGAPLIANFYGQGYELLTPIMRVLGLRIIVAAINTVQQAYFSKHMIFERFFWATLFGTILSAIVGILLAYNGFGVWALVAQYLTNTTVDTIVLAFFLNKLPKFTVDYKRLKEMLKFGSKILGAGLLTVCYQQLRAVIIGKLYSSEDLAFYDKGKQFPDLLVSNVTVAISAVLFPQMSNVQDDLNKVKKITKQAIRFGSYIMFPMMFGLTAISHNFVLLLLTEKWLPCATLLQLFCIYYLFQPLHIANIQAMKALGKGSLCLNLELIRDVIQLVSLIAVMWVSVDAIVISMTILSVFFTALNSYPNKKLINYGFSEQMKDITMPLIMSIVMVIFVYSVGLLPLPIYIQLFLQVIIGGGIYLILSIISKNREYLYLINLVKAKLCITRHVH